MRSDSLTKEVGQGLHDLPWLEESARNENLNGHRSPDKLAQFFKKRIFKAQKDLKLLQMQCTMPLGKKAGLARRAGSRSQNVQFIALGPRDSDLSLQAPHTHQPPTLPSRPPLLDPKKRVLVRCAAD